MQITRGRRNQQGNLLIGILILIVGVIIVVKLWTTCAKLFPPPPKPGSASTNGATNSGDDAAVSGDLLWLNLPTAGPNTPPSTNYRFVLWGMMPTNNPMWRSTNGVGYLQMLDPESGQTGLSYPSFTNTMAKEYGVTYDTNNPVNQAFGIDTNGYISVGYANQPFGGYITLNQFVAMDNWQTVYLQKSTNGVDWFNVVTNSMKCGEFQMFLDLGGDRMALYRMLLPGTGYQVPVNTGPPDVK